MADREFVALPRLRLLGEVALFRDGAYIALPPSKKTRALLVYLAATSRSHRRERLCSLLWDVPDDPRGALRWSLSRLRPLLDEAGCPRILADRDNVALAVDTLDIDLHFVARQMAREHLPANKLAETAALFEGDFAEGLELGSCADFQAWLMTQREAARRLHLQLLERVIEGLPPREALAFAQRRLEIDADVVAHHAQMLELLIKLDRRREAEQQAALSIERLRQLDPESGDALASQWRRLQDLPGQIAEKSAGAGEAETTTPSHETADAWLEERKQVSILYINQREIALNVDPETAADRQPPLLRRMELAIERYGGTIAQQRPDGITALFGAPIACQNHTARACLAALLIQESSPEDKFGISIHAGEVLLRGRDSQIQAFGPALRIAQEIERVTPPHMIYLARRSFQLVDGLFLADPGAVISLPGIEEPLELLALTGQAAILNAWYARTVRGLTTFVGRQHEIDALLRQAQKAQTAAGQAAVVVGEPGLGKSRLLHELLSHDTFEPTAWQRLEGATTPYDQDTPHFLIGRLLRNWLQIGPRAPEDDVRAKLVAAIAALDPNLAWTATPLGVPLDLTPDDDWAALDASVRRRQILDAFDGVLGALAQQLPVLILIEDWHWADADSAAIIEAVVNRLARRHIFLLVTTRPEGTPDWIAKSTCQALRLDTLDPRAAEKMAAALLGTDDSLNDLIPQLIERTGGTPLFLEEAVFALVGSGVLAGTRGAYRLVKQQHEFQLPATIQAVLGERIDRLTKPLKLLLQVAAVIGDDIPMEILLPLMDLDRVVLDEQLEALQAVEFLFETRPSPNRHFAFKHALTRDVAYASLSMAQRQKLHRRVLKIILRQHKRRGDELVERLAYHAVNAQRWALAATFLRRAGDKGVRRSAYREAVRSYESNLQILQHLAETDAARRYSVTLRLRLRPPLGAVAAFTRAFEHLLIAENLAAARGDIARMTAIVIHKSYILSSQGQIELAIRAAEQAKELAARSGDSLTMMEAHLAFGQACAFRGDAAGAIAAVTPFRERLTTELRHERLGQTGVRSVWCLMHLADALTLKGDLVQARRITTEALQIAEEVDRPYDRAVVHLREGFIEIHADNAPRAVAAFDRSHVLSEGSDLGWVSAWARTGLGYAYALSGHMEAGLNLLEATRQLASESEFVAVQAMSTVYLADIRHRRRQWVESNAEAEAALAMARNWGYWDIEVMALLCLGQTAANQHGGEARAVAFLREAAALAEQRGYRPMLAQSHALLAAISGQARAVATASTGFEDAPPRETP